MRHNSLGRLRSLGEGTSYSYLYSGSFSDFTDLSKNVKILHNVMCITHIAWYQGYIWIKMACDLHSPIVYGKLQTWKQDVLFLTICRLQKGAYGADNISNTCTYGTHTHTDKCTTSADITFLLFSSHLNFARLQCCVPSSPFGGLYTLGDT